MYNECVLSCVICILNIICFLVDIYISIARLILYISKVCIILELQEAFNLVSMKGIVVDMLNAVFPNCYNGTNDVSKQ